MASEDLPANGHGGPADPTKTSLRRAMRAARAAYVARLEPDERARLEASLVASLIDVVGDGIVAGYAAVGAEVDLRSFPHSLALPRITPDGLRFHRCPIGALVAGTGGIPEPAAHHEPVEPDVILVPLLAVDPAGNRLGQGGGHYDRTLAALRARRPVVAVGVAWDVQLVAALPADPWDEPLDWVATPTRLLRVRPGGELAAACGPPMSAA